MREDGGKGEGDGRAKMLEAKRPVERLVQCFLIAMT